MDNKSIVVARLVCGLVVCSLLFLASCGAVQKKPPYGGRPEWIYASPDPGKTCAVGVALPHVKGLSSQRAMAISRAIEEIARQQQVEVTVDLEAITSGSQTGMQSRLNTYSVQTTDSTKVINATVTNTWMDETTREFYVRMCTP